VAISEQSDARERKAARIVKNQKVRASAANSSDYFQENDPRDALM